MYIIHRSSLWRAIYEILRDSHVVSGGAQEKIEDLTWKLYWGIKGKRR